MYVRAVEGIGKVQLDDHVVIRHCFQKKRSAAWTAASQPPGVPTASWIGLKKVDRRAIACVLAHFDTKRRSVNPTAMGRIPPDFLINAINCPPKKMGTTIFT